MSFRRFTLLHLVVTLLVCGVLECRVSGEDKAPPAGRRDPLPGLVPAPRALPGIGRWQLAFKLPHGRIQAIAWSPDGRKIALSDMSYVRICDAETFATEHLLAGHANRVSSIDWNRKTNRIASASCDGTVRIWSADGVPQKTLNGHTQEVNAVAWSQSGDRLASAGNDGTVRIWNGDGSLVRIIRVSSSPVNCVAWRPDGTRFATGDDNHQVKLWNADGSLRCKCGEGHLAPVTLVAWGPGGKRLASATCGFLNSDGKTIADVRLWDADGTPTGSLLRESRVFGLEWNPDGSLLTLTNNRGQLQFIRPNGKVELLQKIAQIGGEISEPHLAWNPNGKEIAVAGTGRLLVVNPDDVKQVRLSPRASYGVNRNVAFPAIDRNRDRAIVGPAGGAASFGLWNLSTASVTDLPAGLTIDRLNSQSFSPTGDRIAFVQGKTRLATWNTNTGAIQAVTQSEHPIVDVVWGPPEEIAYSDDEGTLRVVKTDGSKTFEWRPQRPPQATAPGNGPLVYIGGQRAARFHWRGRALVVGEGTAFEARRLDGSDAVMFDFGSPFQRSWITRDLQLALALFNEEGKRFLKICRAGQEPQRLPDWPKDITCFDASGDLTRFVAGCRNGELILWRLDDPKASTEAPVAAKWGRVVTVVFSPNGQRFATGGWDSLVKIWKPDGSLERTLYDNTLPVGRLWWSGNGKELLAIAHNGTFCRWKVDDGCLESRIVINENGKPIRIGRDGRVDSPEPESIGEDLCALLEKPDGSVEIVAYSEFLKRTGLAAQEMTDPKRK